MKYRLNCAVKSSLNPNLGSTPRQTLPPDPAAVQGWPVGCYVALVTPFDDEGEIDWKAVDRLVEGVLQANVAGLVLLGTTGEAGSLSRNQKISLIQRVVSINQKVSRLIVGTGGQDTRQTADWNQEVGQFDIDATMVVSPYYNRPNEEGLVAHFKAIANACEKPIILYDHPLRTGTRLTLSLLQKLATIPEIMGIKDAQSSLEHSHGLVIQKPSHWLLLSGDDSCGLAQVQLGYDGLVSVVANAIPAYLQAAIQWVKQWHTLPPAMVSYRELCQGLACDMNPIAIKWLLHSMGKMSPHLSLPLTTLGAQHHATLTDCLARVNELNNISQTGFKAD